MIPLAKFLLALTNLVRSGGIRNIPQAIKFAEQQFGKVTPLLKKQIQNVFDKAKKPVVGKPGKKEGTVLPMIKEAAEESEEGLGIKGLKNPKRPGGSLDPAIGLTRTLARRILDKKGIEIGKNDPLDVFLNNFGVGSGTDIQNLADQIVEAEQTGRNLKPLDDLIEIEGFFDLKVQKNPDTGISTEDLVEQLEKDLKEKEILEDFDPTDREPNAAGGLAGILKL